MIKNKNTQKTALLGPLDMSFDMPQSRDNNSVGGQEYKIGDQIKGGRADNLSRKTILVCDDEADLLLMFRIHLESRYNVLTVDSGKACIEKLLDRKNNNEKVDLLLLDYKLGDISGDVVARKIKDIEDTRILLITAFELDDKVIQDLVQNKYVVDVIKKPILLEQLSQKIEENMK
jgi:CheY-like chemotaxis protein